MDLELDFSGLTQSHCSFTVSKYPFSRWSEERLILGSIKCKSSQTGFGVKNGQVSMVSGGCRSVSNLNSMRSYWTHKKRFIKKFHPSINPVM